MNHAVICTKVMLLKTSENVFHWLNGEYFKLMFQKLGGLGGGMPLHAEYCDRIMQQLRNHRLRTQLVDRVQLHKVRIQIRNRQMEIVQIQQKQM